MSPPRARPTGATQFWELIQSIKARKKTIILTTHYMDEAELLFDEIAIVDRGRIIAQGPPRRLLQEHFAESHAGSCPDRTSRRARPRLPLRIIDMAEPNRDHH